MHAAVPKHYRAILGGLGRFVRSITALGVFAVAVAQALGQQPFVTLEGDPKKDAWWVIADFHPFTTEVRGIPAGKIQKGWCKATEFRKDLIPKELLVEGGVDAMEEAKLSFALQGHFDGSAATQVALVGVYQECTGRKGRFVLILDQLRDGKAKVRFLSAVPTDHQFGVLSLGKDNTIVAWTCMDCDNISRLKWDRRKRRFEWLPEPEQD